MGKEAKLWAFIGIVLGIIVMMVALDIINLKEFSRGSYAMVKSAFVLMFSLVAILFGMTALSKANSKERILCYAPIALGIVAFVAWLITELK